MAVRKKKPKKPPRSLGACADRLLKLREEKSLIQRQLDTLDEERRTIENHLIENLPKSNAEGIMGKTAKAVVTSKVVASVKDWDKFYKYLLKSKDFSLMQRRVNDKSWRDQVEDGKKIPGVEGFNAIKVSVTKR